MGIAQFFSHLKSTYGKTWIKSIPAEHTTYDYLILDFQSIVYNIHGAYGNEINYLIKLLEIYNGKVSVSEKKVFVTDHLNEITNIMSIHRNLFVLCDFTNDQIDNYLRELQLNKTPSLVDNFLKEIYRLNFKSKWEDYLIFKTTEYVIELADQYVKSDNKFTNTFIFFDGIPSYAKIKEQVARRLYPDIINAIKQNVANDLSIMGNIDFEITLRTKFVSLGSLGPNTNLANKLRCELSRIKDDTKGQFFINGEKILGEAEHQIMKYLQDNHTLFNDKKILLASPDADLILLSFINKTKGFNIDLLRINKINEDDNNFKIEDFLKYNTDESPFYITKEIIIIDILLKVMNLTDNQKIIDLSFILLLLGDDFLPKIPTLKITNLQDIINTYDKVKLNIVTNSQNIFTLNHENLLLFLTELISENKEVRWDEDIKTIHNKKIKDAHLNIILNYNTYAEKKMTLPTVYKIMVPRPLKSKMKNTLVDAKYNPGSTISYQFYNIKRYLVYLLENAGLYSTIQNIRTNPPPIEFFYVYREDATKQIESLHQYFKNNVFKSRVNLLPLTQPIDEEKLENYLEGYSFILDIYFNNNLKNYEWVYKYNNAPTITEIVTFINSKRISIIPSLFNYVNKRGSKNDINQTKTYMNFQNYALFVEKTKLVLVKNIAKKIIDKTIIEERKQKALDDLDKMDKNMIMITYFTYSNVSIIFECSENYYLNKCIEVNLLELSSSDPVKINSDGNLEFEKKYLKYKTKYLALKNKLGL